MPCRLVSDDLALPTAPVGLTAVAAGHGIALNWTANPSSQRVTAYKVYRSIKRTGGFSLLTTTALLSYTDSTATGNVLYWFRVTAVNLKGEGPYADVSGSWALDVTAPAAPSGLVISQVGPQAAALDWTDNTETDLAGYNVRSSLTAGSGYVLLNSSGLLPVSSYTDMAATPGGGSGRTWFYRVTAVDQAGNESANVQGSIFIASPDVTAPATPSGVVASDTGSAISVVWIPNTETDLAGYNIYRSDDSFATRLNGGVLTVPGYTDSTAAVGVPYSYKVEAKDTTGNVSSKSVASNTVTRQVISMNTLDPYVYHGEMVPCGLWARGVPNASWYLIDGSTSSSGHLDEGSDFPQPTVGSVITAQYDWNMAAGANDPQGQYPTGRGFNYAHGYDQAVKHTIKLTRTQEDGKIETWQTTFTPAPDTRTKVYVASDGSGSSTNNGQSQASPVNLSRANQLIQASPNVKLLLRQGDRFKCTTSNVLTVTQKNTQITSTSGFTLPGKANVLPVFTWSVAGGGRQFIYVSSRGLWFAMSLVAFDIDYANEATPNDFCLKCEGDGAYVRKCLIIKASEFFHTSDSVPTLSHYGLLENNQAPNYNSLEAYFCFCNAHDFVFLGNFVQNSQGQHPIRCNGHTRVNIQYNTFNQFSAGTTGLKFDIIKTVTAMQHGIYTYFGRNTTKVTFAAGDDANTGSLGVGPLIGPTGSFASRTRYIVVEENHMEGTYITIDGQVEYAYIRNNYVSHVDGIATVERKHSSGLDKHGAAYVPGGNDIYIVNNTLMNNGTFGRFFESGTPTDRLYFKNNICIGTNMRAGQAHCLRFTGGLNNTWDISRNVFPSLNVFLVGTTTLTVAQFNTRTGAHDNVIENEIIDTVTVKPSFATTNGATLGRPVKGNNSSFNKKARNQSDPNWTPGCYQL